MFVFYLFVLVEGEEACWHKYGTCQHKHIPKLANEQYPGNVTTIPGLTTDDAKKAPLCTRESSMCKCRSDKCESKQYVFFSSDKNKIQSMLGIHYYQYGI